MILQWYLYTKTSSQRFENFLFRHFVLILETWRQIFRWWYNFYSDFSRTSSPTHDGKEEQNERFTIKTIHLHVATHIIS